MSRVQPPPSATHAAIAWIGAAALISCVGLLNFRPLFQDVVYQALLVMGVTALAVFVPDLLWQRIARRSLGAPGSADWARVLCKTLGLFACVGCIGVGYALFPEYHDSYYDRYWRALETLAVPWLLLTVPYLYWVDRRMTAPRDGLWQMGRLVLWQWRDAQPAVIAQTLLGWLVKGFFLPLMFVAFCDNLSNILQWNAHLPLASFKGFYDFAFVGMYFVDVAWVSMTYLMALRLTDTHIRSTEPTLLGWFVALACYQPFWSLVGSKYLAYDAATQPWGDWMQAVPMPYRPVIYASWGTVILLLVAVYVWATISFGGRFSNLTHRGIITNGPYRYLKHPAYVAKNLSWWLLSMPFMLNGSPWQSLRQCLLLLMLNGIYFLRAKTEERHLWVDPIYAAYAAWVEQHGALRGLARLPAIGALIRWRPA